MEILTTSLAVSPLIAVTGVGSVIALLLGIILSIKMVFSHQVAGFPGDYRTPLREKIACGMFFVLWVVLGGTFIFMNQAQTEMYHGFLSRTYAEQHEVHSLVPLGGSIIACTEDSRADRMLYAWEDEEGETYTGILRKSEEVAGTCTYTLTAAE